MNLHLSIHFAASILCLSSLFSSKSWAQPCWADLTGDGIMNIEDVYFLAQNHSDVDGDGLFTPNDMSCMTTTLRAFESELTYPSRHFPGSINIEVPSIPNNSNAFSLVTPEAVYSALRPTDRTGISSIAIRSDTDDIELYFDIYGRLTRITDWYSAASVKIIYNDVNGRSIDYSILINDGEGGVYYETYSIDLPLPEVTDRKGRQDRDDTQLLTVNIFDPNSVPLSQGAVNARAFIRDPDSPGILFPTTIRPVPGAMGSYEVALPNPCSEHQARVAAFLEARTYLQYTCDLQEVLDYVNGKSLGRIRKMLGIDLGQERQNRAVPGAIVRAISWAGSALALTCKTNSALDVAENTFDFSSEQTLADFVAIFDDSVENLVDVLIDIDLTDIGGQVVWGAREEFEGIDPCSGASGSVMDIIVDPPQLIVSSLEPYFSSGGGNPGGICGVTPPNLAGAYLQVFNAQTSRACAGGAYEYRLYLGSRCLDFGEQTLVTGRYNFSFSSGCSCSGTGCGFCGCTGPATQGRSFIELEFGSGNGTRNYEVSVPLSYR